MKKIVVVGEILVEIMADTLGDGFGCPQALTGPFPSGAPAIFADQVAKLGQPVAMISCVGDDDFGRLNIDRLIRDGVDVSGISIDNDRPTGSAFVRYRDDGSRDFVFNIKHSACGSLHITSKTRELLDAATHLHIMGSSLANREFVELNITTARAVRVRGGTVSFDPNLRKEMLAASGMTEAMGEILTMTDLFLPSGDELTLLTQSLDEEQAKAELFGLGVKVIVHKNGSNGASYTDSNENFDVAAFNVNEIDPTGAGDSFGGAFTTFWLRGMAPREALRLATAAGALAVKKRGPMEGNSSLSEIANFLDNTVPAELSA